MSLQLHYNIAVAANSSSLTPRLIHSSRTHLSFSASSYPTLRRRFPGRIVSSSSSSVSSNPSSLPSPNASTNDDLSGLDHMSPFLKRERHLIVLGWLCNAASVFFLSSVVPKVGRLPSIVLEQLAAAKDGRPMALKGIVLVALASAWLAARYLQEVFLWEAAMRIVYSARIHVFDRVLQRDLGFFEGKESVATGDISYRITAEAADVTDTVYSLLNATVPNILQLMAMATQMVMINPWLSVLTALATPCILIMISNMGDILSGISKRADLSAARLSAYLNELLPSMLAVKASIGEPKESLRFQSLAYDDLLQRLKKKKMKVLLPLLVQALYIGGLTILGAGTLLFSRNPSDCSNFCSFAMALIFLIAPIQGMGKAVNELKQGNSAIERLFDLARFPSKVSDKYDAVELDSIKGDIKFCGVTFGYSDDVPCVLDGLSLHIQPGERVALIGPSGGGKTTLSKLLLRLYEPQCGSIFVDNHDIRDIKLRSLRKHIALVSQESMLFSGTVAENIGYRDSVGHLNQEHIENAASIANADAFIRTLPEGYKTNIGQRGSLLSGGQKQRLSIARALYMKASILILDEATSALDSRSEVLVRQALERVMMNRTVLIIAHRLETIMMADRILVLDGGKVEEVPKSALLTPDGHHNLQALARFTV